LSENTGRMTTPLVVDAVSSDGKRARLLRIKIVATGLLPIMATIFALSAALKGRYPFFAWVEAFAEAALVGGLADWFAVVALFRHPGGLPLPHTAIIPNNKARIGAQLGVFVEQNFLTPGNITAKLAQVDLAETIVRWLAESRNSRRAIAASRDYLPLVVEVVDEPDIERVIGRVVAEEIDRLDFAHTASVLVTTLTDRGRHQRAVDEVLPVLTQWLHDNRSYVKKRFSKKSILTPAWIDTYIVNQLVDGVIDLIGEISRDPSHEMRLALDRYLSTLALSLDNDPEFSKKAEDIKAAIIHGREVESAVASAWRSIKGRVSLPSDGLETSNEAWLADVVTRVARSVLTDRPLLDRMNENIIALVETALSRFQHTFATLIEDIVNRWDTQQVTEKVELELGPDLQFIRLNGTFIGGLAGIALHAALVVMGVAP
jgi:uncharacterized membrane-anchored protein YjiN (DUF445 family)